MKINRITLTNYGPYGGHNEIDLRTTEDEPIILFGGQNGSGKTTLFNAIQLCLHGRSAFDGAISMAEYEDKLRGLLHESGGEKATTASIKLEFEYADFGESERYVVERQFRDRGKSIVEDVEVRRNGSELSDLEEDQWEDFLKELIPPGISQLFFFDGEKVENLAHAIEDDDQFGDSLMSLLGLDLVERLETDLTIYQSQKLDEEGHEELAEEITEVREDIDEAQTEKADLEEQIQTKTARIEELNEEIDHKEQQLAQEGGTFAERRDEYKEERARLEADIDNLRDDIRELVMGAYPFALAPDLCREVVEQLEAETEAKQLEAARSKAVSALGDVSNEEDVWAELEVPADQSDQIVSTLQEALSDELAPPEQPSYQLSNEFSEKEQQEMINLVDRALTALPDELQELTEELEAKTRRRQEVEEKISSAPSQSVIEPLLEEINELNSERTRLEQDIEAHRERVESLENHLGRLESGLEKRLERQQEFDDVSDRSQLASKVQRVVQSYSDRLVEQKLDRLQEVVTDRYLQLSNKDGFYQKVIVDSDDLSVYIETKEGNTKHQSQLSAGERQIFATALLWALADISGRPLPFIIDTPLGRLDKKHRGRLVKNFFPNAAHQVFLFSTDTEITAEYREMLRDDIAAEFHLVNDTDTGKTSVSQGYFGVDSDEAIQDTDENRVTTEMQLQDSTQPDLEGFSDD